MPDSHTPLLERVQEDLEDALFGDTVLRPVTKSLIIRLLMDLPLTPAVSVDFGVETEEHHRALKAALDQMADGRPMPEIAIQLDQACGDGPALTDLVEEYAPEYSGVTFHTPYDGVDVPF